VNDVCQPERATQNRVIALFRDEPDKQIEGVFASAGEAIYRTSSGWDLMSQLGQATPRLLYSLVHEFGPKSDKKTDEQFGGFIKAQGEH